MKLCLFNVENLFLLKTQDSYVKPEDKVKWLASTIKDINPDILMLCEVGGLPSLDLFNSKYLDNVYFSALLNGNSDRGIEMGYLIKRDLPYFHQIISHKDEPLNFHYPHEMKTIQYAQGKLESHKFSRDISELRLIENNKIKLIILLVHLKSKLDKDCIDFNGNLRRKAEVNKLVEHYLTTRQIHPSVPIIVSGDFNGNAQKDGHEPEFSALYDKTDLLDVLEVINEPPQQRFSYFYFTRENQKEASQLDYILLSKDLQDLVIQAESGIYHYKDNHGVHLPYPEDSFQRYALPSDHYPVVLKLKI